MSCLRVTQPGLMSTVQDMGRFGHSSIGVPESGAVDSLSLRAGNRLLGNADQAAAIEMTLTGGEFEFDGDAAIVLAGAAMPARIRSASGPVRELPHGASVTISAGETLTIGPASTGCRAYLCVRGGIDVPIVIGSRSTCLPGGFGGHAGRPLRAGDALKLGRMPTGVTLRAPSAEALAWLHARVSRRTIRVTRSAQTDAVPGAFERLVSSAFRASPHSDRAGLRLGGTRIELSQSGRMISEGTPLGGVQLPEGGEPIILLQDRPTTGGYPVIACVIGADIAAVGQLRPGDEVRFEEVSIEVARGAWREQEGEFDRCFPVSNGQPPRGR